MECSDRNKQSSASWSSDDRTSPKANAALCADALRFGQEDMKIFRLIHRPIHSVTFSAGRFLVVNMLCSRVCCKATGSIKPANPRALIKVLAHPGVRYPSRHGNGPAAQAIHSIDRQAMQAPCRTTICSPTFALRTPQPGKIEYRYHRIVDVDRPQQYRRRQGHIMQRRCLEYFTHLFYIQPEQPIGPMPATELAPSAVPL